MKLQISQKIQFFRCSVLRAIMRQLAPVCLPSLLTFTTLRNESVNLKTVDKWRPVHKTTLLILFLFVVLPWILVAIPGQASSVDISSFDKGVGFPLKMLHGWPATYLASTKHDNLLADHQEEMRRYNDTSPDPSPPAIEKKCLTRAFEHDEQASLQFAHKIILE